VTSLYDCGTGGAYLHIGVEAPGTPAENMLWLDPSSSALSIYQSGAWQPLILSLAQAPTYADETAAAAAGLASGSVYQTPTGELRVKL